MQIDFDCEVDLILKGIEALCWFGLFCSPILKMLTLALILVAGFSWSFTAGRECDDAYEFPCVNGVQCIHKLQWCDTRQDCSDGSDENFCDGRAACMDAHFRCKNGRCIPRSGYCDNNVDCTDGSDEEVCANVIARRNENLPITEDVYTDLDSGTKLAMAGNGNVRQAVLKAAEYLVGKRQSDFGWSSSTSTSRAVVALAFAENIEPRDENEKNLMKQQLDIQLSLDLMASNKETSLSHVALYVNALYATCQDPHNSQGMDLVNILRLRTDAAMNSTNFSLPTVLLTLCIAEKNKRDDIEQLAKMYGGWGMDRLGSKALALMAMTCNGRRGAVRNYESYAQDFFALIGNLKADVYTEALIIQAFNAVQDITAIRQTFDYPQRVQKLLDQQRIDGSFGDLLSTYYAIPALLGTSLLEMKCKDSKQNEGTMGDSLNQVNTDAKKISYTIWFPSDTEDSVHSTVITFSGNKTVYDLMKMAAARDSMFRFSTDDTEEGRKIYSLAGIPNDAETGMTWTLYTTRSGRAAIRSMNSLLKVETGLDRIFPNGDYQYIFWLKRS